jgi:hypothetical protein
MRSKASSIGEDLLFAEEQRARTRLLGLLPLIFFLAQALHYWRIDQLGHLLWMCNIGNLLLAVGLFLEQPLLIRVAVIWSIPGLFVWARYVVVEWFHYATLDWSAVASSSIVHLGGLAVGLYSLRRVGMDRQAWLYSFVWYLIVQMVSRFITPPELNVNVSQRIYEGWQRTFDAYWKFWLVLSTLVAICLWLLGLVLKRVWPSRPAAQSP